MSEASSATAVSVATTATTTTTTTTTTTVGMPITYTAPILKPVAVAMRPMTSSSHHHRLSMTSLASTRRPLKYGTGKHAQTELVPQPSDDEDDPLNWSAPKKEACYWTLLLLAALVGVSKTALFSVGSQLAVSFSFSSSSSSYTAVAALTGAPLLVSAVTGLASLVACRFCGKRALYLVATVCLLAGTIWSAAAARHSYAQCMAARVVQGLGWGVFDVLVRGSIGDLFFEHERGVRDAVYCAVVVASTWGGALLDGVVVGGGGSDHPSRIAVPFVVLSSLFGVALVLLLLAVPETTYDRSFYSTRTPATTAAATAAGYWPHKDLPLRPRAKTWSPGGARTYLSAPNLRPVAYSANLKTLNSSAATATATATTAADLLWQAPRAMAAPTTVLLALASVLPLGALWATAASLSLFFAPRPYSLSPASVGALFVAPLLLATAVAVVGAACFGAGGGGRRRRLAVSSSSSSSSSALARIGALAAGTLLSVVGLLVFGLYTAAGAAANPAHLDFPAVSLLLGLLAAGAYLLDATVRPMVGRSTRFTSASLAVAQRNTSDMCAAVGVWRTLVVGALVMAWLHAAGATTTADAAAGLLRAPSIGIAVAQVVVAAAVAVVWWRFDEAVHRIDGQVMRCVDLGLLKRTGSFFDVDD